MTAYTRNADGKLAKLFSARPLLPIVVRKRLQQLHAKGWEEIPFPHWRARRGFVPQKQEWFDALDFSYDMSVPNVAHLDPQRGGCCTVMPYFVGKNLGNCR